MTKIKYKHIRFLGAAGIGMTALTQILESRGGVKISRSDLSYAANGPLDADIDLVVRSTAVTDTDPDLIELRGRGLEVWHRSDMLSYLSANYKQLVVTGTHGKTTCTAMLAHLLVHAGLDPSYAVGGVLANYGNNGKAGQGEYFVLEGDESDKSYLKSNPYLVLLTYIEPDHLENYPGGFDEIKKCFLGFLDRSLMKVVCIDDPVLADYARTHESTVTYGSSLGASGSADFYVDILSRVLTVAGRDYKLELGMQGGHNLINACGVIAVAHKLGISVEASLKALAQFKGIKRRFELINAAYGIHHVQVYDDYAHHPTEVKALVSGALAMKPKRLVLVYQPHHPERTKQLWQDFVEVFKWFSKLDAGKHLALVAEIYVARSKHIEGISSRGIVAAAGAGNVRFLAPSMGIATPASQARNDVDVGVDAQGNYKDMVAALKPSIDEVLEDGDLLLIAGAGNIAKIVTAFI